MTEMGAAIDDYAWSVTQGPQKLEARTDGLKTIGGGVAHDAVRRARHKRLNEGFHGFISNIGSLRG
jgi:hypothetical protein